MENIAPFSFFCNSDSEGSNENVIFSRICVRFLLCRLLYIPGAFCHQYFVQHRAHHTRELYSLMILHWLTDWGQLEHGTAVVANIPQRLSIFLNCSQLHFDDSYISVSSKYWEELIMSKITMNWNIAKTCSQLLLTSRWLLPDLDKVWIRYLPKW